MECPVCYRYMSPPIRVCSKGHSSCDKCTKKLSTCTKCQYPFLTTRNLALEAISFEMDIKCKNCDKYFTSDIFYQHNCDIYEENEEFEEKDNVYLCRVSQLDKNYNRKICRWTGFISDISEHFLNEHSTSYFTLDHGKTFRWTLPFAQDQENISVIAKQENLFLQEVFYENKTKILYFAVYNIDTRNNKEFNFQITVAKKNNRVFESKVFKNYKDIKKLKEKENVVEIDIDVFDMRKDREIKWILSID